MRRNQGLVYAILVALTGSVLSLPLVLSLLTLWSGHELYANTQEDPLPALYRLSFIPTWISAGASIVTLLMWPLLGLLVVLVTRPKSVGQAVLSGMVVGAVCGLLFFSGHRLVSNEQIKPYRIWGRYLISVRGILAN